MMYLAITFVLSCVVKMSMAGCGTASQDEPRIAITTSTISDAGSDDKLLGKIRVNGEWTDWTVLDNKSCNDLVKGETDFFDDFAAYTEEWEAIALYECGTDGVAIDSISYWNGASNDNTVGVWCNNVAGIFNLANYDEEIADPPTGQCYRGADADVATQPMYDVVWLDQNNGRIPGISFGTGEYLFGDRSQEGPMVGRLFFRSVPGVPVCGDYTLAQEVEERQANVLDTVSVVYRSEITWVVYLVLGTVALVAASYAVYRIRSGTAKQYLKWQGNVNYGTVHV